MAKTKNGVLGAFYGKIGPVVGANWKGIDYIRSMPTKSKKKPSLAQVAHREKFKFLSLWLEPLYNFITLGFLEVAKQCSEVNYAFRYNYQRALMGDYPTFSIAYDRVFLSHGSLWPPIMNEPVQLSEGELILSWSVDSHRNALHNDQLMLVLIAPELGLCDGCVGLATRGDGILVYAYAKRFQGQEVELYVSFIGMRRKRVSDSVYLGRTRLP